MARSRSWGAPALVLLLVACGGGSVQAEARAGGDVQTFDFDRPLAEEDLVDEDPEGQHRRALASVEQQEAATAQTGEQHALLGARRDLRLGSSVQDARCQCLGVVLGPPNTAGMDWRGPPPSVHPIRQIVIALGSEGVLCANNPQGHVASYQGYTVEGGNVIVSVEIARSGRPVTHGAIIPRPDGPGRVYVQPANQQVPFGRGLDGAPRCDLGNPGS